MVSSIIRTHQAEQGEDAGDVRDEGHRLTMTTQQIWQERVWMFPKEKVGTKPRDNVETKLTGHDRQLFGAGWYRKKAELILRFSPGYPERDSRVKGASLDVVVKMGLFSEMLNFR